MFFTKGVEYGIVFEFSLNIDNLLSFILFSQSYLMIHLLLSCFLAVSLSFHHMLKMIFESFCFFQSLNITWTAHDGYFWQPEIAGKIEIKLVSKSPQEKYMLSGFHFRIVNVMKRMHGEADFIGKLWIDKHSLRNWLNISYEMKIFSGVFINWKRWSK